MRHTLLVCWLWFIATAHAAGWFVHVRDWFRDTFDGDGDWRYAPVAVDCPANGQLLVREASGLSQNETEWLEKRHKNTTPQIKHFLERNGVEFDVNKLGKHINIGLAFSGGGYRALLNGAGMLAAMDSRVYGANESGLGGLLQASTYMAGLSGGNWLTSTMVFNNWVSVDDIMATEEIWNLEKMMLISDQWGGELNHMTDLVQAVKSKKEAHFNTTITDIWGRALSYQLLNSTHEHFSNLSFSTLREYALFDSGHMPFPIFVALGRALNTTIVNLNSTVFEFNPFEMGSWDPSLNAFADLKYIGSEISGGSPVGEKCVVGFDNTGFVLGTSSSMFNVITLHLNTTNFPPAIKDIFKFVLNELGKGNHDVASYEPNPFFETNYATGSDSIAKSKTLYLVDGGEDTQNIPLQPLLQPEREVDVIFAFDNSANTEDTFADGTSLIATYDRQFTPQGADISFPPVPNTDTFVYNLSSKPTFFGCDYANLTDLTNSPPLVVYIPNMAYSFWSNTSTEKPQYTKRERNGMIRNGFEVSSRLNHTLDENWPRCVGCPIVKRSVDRGEVEMPEGCAQCFEDYCWNGEVYSGGDDGKKRYFFHGDEPDGISSPEENQEHKFHFEEPSKHDYDPDYTEEEYEMFSDLSSWISSVLKSFGGLFGIF